MLALGWIAWGAAGLYVDWLWFGSLGYAQVFGKRLVTQLILCTAAGLSFGALCLANLRLARALRSGTSAAGAANEGLWTYLARVNASLTGNPLAVERFHLEVRAAARLSHPNIVTAHDADQAGGLHFLVMEYVEGTTLAEFVARKGPLPVAQACTAANAGTGRVKPLSMRSPTAVVSASASTATWARWLRRI